MEHNCPICGKKIYNHLGACYSCQKNLKGNKNPGGIDSAGNDKAAGAILLIAVAGLFLWLAYSYIISLGFNHNSAIAVMVAIPIIILILIFKGEKIYWALRSLSQDKWHKKKYKKENREGFIWFYVIVFFLIIVLFFQFSLSISSHINNFITKVEKIQADNSFVKLAKTKGYPKPNTLSNIEIEELCTMKCNSNSMDLNSYTLNAPKFDVVDCRCSNANLFILMQSGTQYNAKSGIYYLDVKTLKELTREEFLIRMGKEEQNITPANLNLGEQDISPADYQKTCETSCGGSLKLETVGPGRGKGYFVSDYGNTEKHALICECGGGSSITVIQLSY